jgi:hypothetical protein
MPACQPCSRGGERIGPLAGARGLVGERGRDDGTRLTGDAHPRPRGRVAEPRRRPRRQRVLSCVGANGEPAALLSDQRHGDCGRRHGPSAILHGSKAVAVGVRRSVPITHAYDSPSLRAPSRSTERAQRCVKESLMPWIDTLPGIKAIVAAGAVHPYPQPTHPRRRASGQPAVVCRRQLKTDPLSAGEC